MRNRSVTSRALVRVATGSARTARTDAMDSPATPPAPRAATTVIRSEARSRAAKTRPTEAEVPDDEGHPCSREGDPRGEDACDGREEDPPGRRGGLAEGEPAGHGDRGLGRDRTPEDLEEGAGDEGRDASRGERR